MDGYLTELSLKTQIEEIIKAKTTDYKLFIAKRSPLNHSQYIAEICVVVNLANSYELMRDIMVLSPALSFKGSEVETTDERGVDIVVFEAIFEFFDSVLMSEQDGIL